MNKSTYEAQLEKYELLERDPADRGAYQYTKDRHIEPGNPLLPRQPTHREQVFLSHITSWWRQRIGSLFSNICIIPLIFPLVWIPYAESTYANEFFLTILYVLFSDWNSLNPVWHK